AAVSWDALPEALLADCVQLVKASLIEGNKKDNLIVIYTPASNLKKTGDMAVVSKRDKNVCPSPPPSSLFLVSKLKSNSTRCEARECDREPAEQGEAEEVRFRIQLRRTAKVIPHRDGAVTIDSPSTVFMTSVWSDVTLVPCSDGVRSHSCSCSGERDYRLVHLTLLSIEHVRQHLRRRCSRPDLLNCFHSTSCDLRLRKSKQHDELFA
ncbi:hypothetical protein DFH11DRAFT_1626713, partial [Phellopilus nigrolimitatus]